MKPDETSHFENPSGIPPQEWKSTDKMRLNIKTVVGDGSAPTFQVDPPELTSLFFPVYDEDGETEHETSP